MLNLSKKKLIKLYRDKKLSSIKIAKKFNCTRQTILYYLKKYKIKTRKTKLEKRYCISCGKLIKFPHKFCSKCFYKQNTGSTNPNYKGGKAKCVDCGKELSTYIAKQCQPCYFQSRIGKPGLHRFGKENPNWKHGRPKCIDCNKQLFGYASKRCPSCAHKGKLTKAYIHGNAYLPYPNIFNNSLKLKIRERDNFVCKYCGIMEQNHHKKLSVHHIDYNKFNCREDNLISLCNECHLKTNGNRDYWFAYYIYLMENK
jgi:hypothetical protein